MERILEYQITDEYDGMEVLDFLRKKEFSRRILISMKETGNAIQKNGCPAGGRTLLYNRDLLRIRVPETDVPDKLLPVQMPLSILYEDEDLLVVNKAADVPVHPSAGNHENTLANGTAYYFAQKKEPFVFRCINRLDRDTTGALILAKNPYSGSVLSAQMKRREIHRTYLAIAVGTVPEKGTISAPVGRLPGSALERTVDFANGGRAVTHFQRLAVCDGYSLLRLHLETGRTHQIRVHMRYIGHPLPGDFLYYPDFRRFRRQPLHSYQLEFRHPVSGKELRITAPVPADFSMFMDSSRSQCEM